MRKSAIISFTRDGARLCASLTEYFTGQEDMECRGYVMPRWARSESGIEKLQMTAGEWAGEMFQSCDLLIFVGAVGIAVRSIAPYLQDKFKDPAVLVVDTGGQYVIPILSGHVGRANEYAQELAIFLGAQPVITTATDVHGKFSVDSFAVKNGLYITDRLKAKRISAQVLEGRILHICCAEAQLPKNACFSVSRIIDSQIMWTDNPANADVVISCQLPQEEYPGLTLVPQSSIWIGIGCRKGTEGEAIKAALSEFVSSFGIHESAITGLASIDIKKCEEGILEACDYYRLPFRTYSAAQLMSMEGEFEASDFVQIQTGADNVCDRAALFAAAEDAKRAGDDAFAISVITKQKYKGITLAAAYVNRRLVI